MPHVQEQRAGGVQSHLKSNLLLARLLEGTKKALCVPGPGKGVVTVTRDWVRPARVRGSPVEAGRGTDGGSPGRRHVWGQSPLGGRHWDDPQTGDQLYQRRSRTAVQVLGPTTDSPTWGSGKRNGNPPGIWLCSSAGFDRTTSIGLETRDCWRAQTKPHAHESPGERNRDPARG